MCHTISQRGKCFSKASAGVSGGRLCGEDILGWIAKEKKFLLKKLGETIHSLQDLNTTETTKLL